MGKSTSYGTLAIAIFVLLLPFIYVGSYYALVMPGHHFVPGFRGLPIEGYRRTDSGAMEFGYFPQYRLADRQCRKIFAPLEQLDRRLRPRTWNGGTELIIPGYAGIIGGN